ncbi:MAG: hypothetical protein ACK4K9_07275 [Bacteroidia bacterium]
MKKILLLFVFAALSLSVFAQFGYIKKKWEIDSIKANKIVVVLFPDSAYSESIMQAMEDYWNFSPFEFAEDTSMYMYKKSRNYYLLYSKGKGSKNKAKLCSSVEDFNGFVITNKYSKKIAKENIVAYAHTKNNIDTSDWKSVAMIGVQLLKNYLNICDKAQNENEFSNINRLMSNYPSEKNQLLDKTLLIQTGTMKLEGKEDATALFGGEVEVLSEDEINPRIEKQDHNSLYFYISKDEKFSHKLLITLAGCELLYYSSSGIDKPHITAKELKEVKSMKDKLIKIRMREK